MIAPTYKELAEANPDATFLKVDVDELSSVAAEYSVTSMPTFLVLGEDCVLDKLIGARPDKLREFVAGHVKLARRVAECPAEEGEPEAGDSERVEPEESEAV